MNVSAEFRIKAHISTPYVDADGRGTDGAFAATTADCMKPPEEFRRIVKAQDESRTVTTAEENLSHVLSHMREFHDNVQQQDGAKAVKSATSSAELTAGIVEKRAHQRKIEGERDNLALEEAFRQRNMNEDAMLKFQALSRKSLDSKTRAREEEVSQRHVRILSLRKQGHAVQQEGIQKEVELEKRRENRESEMFRTRLEASQARDEAERRAAAAEELHRIMEERAREKEVEAATEKIKRKLEVELRVLQAERERAIEREQALANEVLQKERLFTQLLLENSEASQSQKYDRLMELQQQFEAQHHEIASKIAHNLHGKGSHFALLVDVAKQQANERHIAFHGLQLLSQATLSPTCLTPSQNPAPDGPSNRTISVQTVISEPLRQGKSRKM